jgi:hypothetical protein
LKLAPTKTETPAATLRRKKHLSRICFDVEVDSSRKWAFTQAANAKGQRLSDWILDACDAALLRRNVQPPQADGRFSKEIR